MSARVLATSAVLGLLALPACFANEGPRFYPEWHRKEASAVSIAGCAVVDGWVAKSGKQGLGLVLHLSGSSPNGCSLAIDGVELRIEERTYRATRLPKAPILREGQHVYAYVPIAFDGNEAWNDDEKHQATLTVTTTPAAAGPIVWPISFELRERFACTEGPPRRPPPKPPPPPPFPKPPMVQP